MLTINNIRISGSASVVEQICGLAASASIEADISNYQRYLSSKSEFVSMLLESDTGLKFDSAYIESAEIREGVAYLTAYSLNGNLSEWAGHVSQKYGVDVEVDMFRGIKPKSYGPDIGNRDDVTEANPKKKPV